MEVGLVQKSHEVIKDLCTLVRGNTPPCLCSALVSFLNHQWGIQEWKKHPEIVRALYRMIVESRALADPAPPAAFPPIGLEANRKGIQLAIDWALDQKIIPRRLSVDELFDDVTGSLG